MAAKTSQPVAAKLRRHMRILVDLGRLMAQKLDIDSFLRQAVIQVARAIEIDHVKILRYRPDRTDLLMIAGTGWKPGTIGTARFPITLESAPGRAFQTAEPVTIPDFAATADFVASPMLTEHGIVSLVNVPVMIDGRPWGVLEVDSTAPRDFGTDSQNFLLAAATVIGAVVQRDQSARTVSEKLAAAAAESHGRELLLAEIQHRVKNNLQIILAMVALQRQRLSAGAARAALDHIANRLTAISLAHDQLAAGQGLRVVALAGYLRALCAAIEQQYEGVMTVDLQADEIDLLIDRAVPVGLILNEAVTNSVKHAFGSAGGLIAVKLSAGIGRGEARLVVSDNGRGVDRARPQGSGSRLMSSLAAQIGGSVDQQSTDRGTTVTLEFPIVT